MSIRSSLLLRSMLFVPTYRNSFIENGLKSNADALIFDLEDSVPDVFKSTARANIHEYVKSGKLKGKRIFVRINPIESKMLFADLKDLIHEDISGFMLTKIYSCDDITFYDNLISQLEKENNIEPGHMKFIPLIETTSAVMNTYSIAKASNRNIALAFGGEDYLDDLHGLHGEPPRAFEFPRSTIALAARAAKILPIDTPYLKLKDIDGFVAEEKISFEMGFAGCLLIHPCQIESAHLCFTPSQDEVQRSLQIIESIKRAETDGSGVAMLGPVMVGPPMRKRAEKVIDLIKKIEHKHDSLSI